MRMVKVVGPVEGSLAWTAGPMRVLKMVGSRDMFCFDLGDGLDNGVVVYADRVLLSWSISGPKGTKQS